MFNMLSNLSQDKFSLTPINDKHYSLIVDKCLTHVYKTVEENSGNSTATFIMYYFIYYYYLYCILLYILLKQ